VPNILAFNPAARFIVLLRNPVDLVYSLHSQLLYGGHEEVEDFETAWRLQAARSQGEQIPLGCPDPQVLQYGSVAKLGEQLERLYRLVPRDRVLVLLQEDLQREPLRVYHQTLEFLGLPTDDRSSFPLRNANRRLRRPRLARLFFFGWLAKRRLGMRRSLGLWRIVSPVLSTVEGRRPLSPELRSELGGFFEDDLRKLSDLVDRDLSSWSSQAAARDDVPQLLE
jgi:hypothetical protein